MATPNYMFVLGRTAHTYLALAHTSTQRLGRTNMRYRLIPVVLGLQVYFEVTTLNSTSESQVQDITIDLL